MRDLCRRCHALPLLAAPIVWIPPSLSMPAGALASFQDVWDTDLRGWSSITESSPAPAAPAAFLCHHGVKRDRLRLIDGFLRNPGESGLDPPAKRAQAA